MNLISPNLKLTLGVVYLVIIIVGVYFLLNAIDIRDLTSYEFLRSNKDIILKYKNNNFLFFTFVFFIFSVIWTLFLGFATPLLLFSGFVFGKWWGILIVIFSTTLGATLLYLLATLFFRDFIEKKLAVKFLKLKKFFNKNDIVYFMFYRFIGGGGTPFAIQNVLPVLFSMPVKNYAIATFLGCIPSMFVTVSFGSGVESVLDKNEQFSFINVLSSPEIYLPIVGFFVLLLSAFFVKKFYFNN